MIENKVYVQYIGENDWKELGNLFGSVDLKQSARQMYNSSYVQYSIDTKYIDSTLTFQLQWIVKQHVIFSDISNRGYNQSQINQIRGAELSKYIKEQNENPTPMETYPDTFDTFQDFISHIRICKIRVEVDEKIYIIDGVVLNSFDPFDDDYAFNYAGDITYMYMRLNCKLIEGAMYYREDDD